MTKNYRSGLIQTFLAHAVWGLFPLYWYLLKHLSALEIMGNRLLWSFLLLGISIFLSKRGAETLSIFRQKKILLILFITSLLISINWYIYIWSVSNGHVLEASLGYYITPLMNILLGMVFLGERFRFYQILALFFAGLGVFVMTVAYGHFPWIALALGLLFSCYSLLRKIITIDSQTALFIETGMLFIPTLIYLLLMKNNSTIIYGESSDQWLLIGAGAITIIPLIFLANGLKVLPLSVVGLIQYISPTLQLIMGIFVFNETFNLTTGVGFLCIWIGLIIYSVESIVVSRRKIIKTRY